MGKIVRRGDRTLHPGKISMHRTQSTEGDHISIYIDDAASKTRVLTIRMDLKAFGEAVSGLSLRECRFEVHGTEFVGKTPEFKEVWEYVRIGDGEYDDRALAAYEKAQAYCKDGWMYDGPRPDAGKYASWSQGDWQDYQNPMGKGPMLSTHRVRLRFVRYTDPVPEPEATTRTRTRVRRPDQQ